MVRVEGESQAPSYVIKIKESPALRLSSLMADAGYTEPAEFIIKALDVFEAAFQPGAGGKVIVENPTEGRRGRKYTFDIRHRDERPVLKRIQGIVTHPFGLGKKDKGLVIGTTDKVIQE